MERTFVNKDLIKKRFSRKLDTYNDNAKIQKKMAEKLAELVTEPECNSVLEIGCGTGLLTALAKQKLSFQKYVAIDIVPECEEYIKQVNPQAEFVPSDIESYIEGSEMFDLIISNASLQWVENLSNIVDKLVQKLNKGGTLIFSTFGIENFREIYYVLGKTLTYYSKQELEEKLSKHNPMIEEEIRVMAFKTPKDVLKHIQNTGVNALSAESWTKNDLMNFEKEYNIFCANHPTLTYHPLFVKIQK